MIPNLDDLGDMPYTPPPAPIPPPSDVPGTADAADEPPIL